MKNQQNISWKWKNQIHEEKQFDIQEFDSSAHLFHYRVVFLGLVFFCIIIYSDIVKKSRNCFDLFETISSRIYAWIFCKTFISWIICSIVYSWIVI